MTEFSPPDGPFQMLLDNEEAGSVLHMPVNSVRTLRPYMHSLELPSGTHVIPFSYATALRGALMNRTDRDYRPTAIEFAKSNEAAETMEEAEQYIDQRITGFAHQYKVPFSRNIHPRFVSGLSSLHVAAVLEISKASVGDWAKTGVLERTQIGRQKRYFIAETALRAAISWQRPQTESPDKLNNFDEIV